MPELGRFLEEGMATHPSILAGRIAMVRAAGQATVHGVAKSWARLSTIVIEQCGENKKSSDSMFLYSYDHFTQL